MGEGGGGRGGEGENERAKTSLLGRKRSDLENEDVRLED